MSIKEGIVQSIRYMYRVVRTKQMEQCVIKGRVYL